MARLARRTDLSTSHEAAAEHVRSGRNFKQQTLVLAALKRTSNVTSRELAAAWNLDRYIVARRLPELRAAKLAVVGPKRKCDVSHRQAVTWRVKAR